MSTVPAYLSISTEALTLANRGRATYSDTAERIHDALTQGVADASSERERGTLTVTLSLLDVAEKDDYDEEELAAVLSAVTSMLTTIQDDLTDDLQEPEPEPEPEHLWELTCEECGVREVTRDLFTPTPSLHALTHAKSVFAPMPRTLVRELPIHEPGILATVVGSIPLGTPEDYLTDQMPERPAGLDVTLSFDNEGRGVYVHATRGGQHAATSWCRSGEVFWSEDPDSDPLTDQEIEYVTAVQEVASGLTRDVLKHVLDERALAHIAQHITTQHSEKGASLHG